MIVFDLHCSQDHAFEGWFDSGDAYADQRARELVRCPVCDSPQIEKKLTSRVQVTRSAAPRPQASTSSEPTAMVAGMPAEVLDKLREIVRNTENVGSRFAEEARKIHYEEVPARAIRGEATRDEAVALHDEGITFTSLPPALTRETH